MPRSVWANLKTWILTLVAICLAFPVMAAPKTGSLSDHDYYLSPNGNDSRDGLSRATAWKTIDRVNQVQFTAGDRVFFCDGTFEGSLTLTPAESGTPAHPIVIESLGPSRATIISSGKPAISARSGGIVISNLVLKGTATGIQKDGDDGVSFGIAGQPGHAHQYVRIDGLDVSGFGGDGIAIGGWDDTGEGYADVRVTHCVCHDNFGSGIATSGKPYGKTYPSSDIEITDCVAFNNRSGSGIVVDGVDHGRVEYCRAFGNIGKGGVGIWAWSADHITIDHCISYGQKTMGGDGDGFDLDGGCQDCVIEYCLSYDNDGCGYMHCDYPYAPPTRENMIRYCISIDDGKGKNNSPGIGFCTWGSGIDDCVLEGNLAVALKQATAQAKTGELWTQYIAPENNDDHPHIQGCMVRNNIIAVGTSGVGFVSNALPGLTDANAKFIDNCFEALDGVKPRDLQSQLPATLQYPIVIPRTEVAAGFASNPGLPPNMASIDYHLTDPHALSRFPLMKALLESPVVKPLEAGH